jgi:hypothetical protein
VRVICFIFYLNIIGVVEFFISQERGLSFALTHSFVSGFHSVTSKS